MSVTSAVLASARVASQGPSLHSAGTETEPEQNAAAVFALDADDGATGTKTERPCNQRSHVSKSRGVFVKRAGARAWTTSKVASNARAAPARCTGLVGLLPVRRLIATAPARARLGQSAAAAASSERMSWGIMSGNKLQAITLPS